MKGASAMEDGAGQVGMEGSGKTEAAARWQMGCKAGSTGWLSCSPAATTSQHSGSHSPCSQRPPPLPPPPRPNPQVADFHRTLLYGGWAGEGCSSLSSSLSPSRPQTLMLCLRCMLSPTSRAWVGQQPLFKAQQRSPALPSLTAKHACSLLRLDLHTQATPNLCLPLTVWHYRQPAQPPAAGL